MTEKLCPLTTYPSDDIRRKCWNEKCAWWDVDDGCCCVRVAVRALEDIASIATSDTFKQLRISIKKHIDKAEK